MTDWKEAARERVQELLFVRKPKGKHALETIDAVIDTVIQVAHPFAPSADAPLPLEDEERLLSDAHILDECLDNVDPAATCGIGNDEIARARQFVCDILLANAKLSKDLMAAQAELAKLKGR